MDELSLITLAAAKSYTDEHGGGGGGADDYNDLKNQPQINGNTLIGNKTASDLGLVAAETGKGLSTNDYDNTAKSIVDGVTSALAGKQNVLKAGNNIKIDNDTISVNRWAVPAGKVVYTVITSDENYGRNVHVQRHTLGGGFIDDRTFFCDMYQTVDIDGLISINNPYASFKITLLEDSDEQQAGYSYNVNPLTTPTSNSFTFMMEQEENDNDLIIRSELDAKQDKLTFDDTPTDNSNNPVKSNGIYDALALKQNATDNSLETTAKTIVGAINEHEGDIGSLKSGLTNYENQNNLNLDVPNRKNLFDPNSNLKLGFSNSIGTNGTFTSGDYYTYVVTKRSVPTFIISGVDFTKMEDVSIRVFTSSSYPAVGVSEWRASNISELASKTVTLSENDKYLVFLIKWEDTATQADKEAIMVEEGDTATSYTPYIPSVESRIEAVEEFLPTAVNVTLDQNVEGAIDDAKVFRFGKLIVGNIRVTLNNTVIGGSPIIHGLPKINTSLAAFSSLCPVTTNKTNVACTIFNEQSNNASLGVATGVTAETGVLMLSFSYVSV